MKSTTMKRSGPSRKGPPFRGSLNSNHSPTRSATAQKLGPSQNAMPRRPKKGEIPIFLEGRHEADTPTNGSGRVNGSPRGELASEVRYGGG